MIHLRDRYPLYIAASVFAAAWLLVLVAAVRADELPKCPDPGVKCKVLFLTEQEEQMLMTKNGILDTAAQARAIDLGQFSVYLKTRIAGAPAGEVKAVEGGNVTTQPLNGGTNTIQKNVDDKK